MRSVALQWTLAALLALIIVLGAEAKEPSLRRIYVLDTELSHLTSNQDYICKESRVKKSKPKCQDYHPHGDNVVDIIGSKIDKSRYCIVPAVVFRGNLPEFDEHAYVSALTKILLDPHAVGINLSQSGTQPVSNEGMLLMLLAAKDVKVIVAAGNDGKELSAGACGAYPACYKVMTTDQDFVVVAASDLKASNRPKFPHEAMPGVMRGKISPMSGTSQAAAEYTGLLFSK